MNTNKARLRELALIAYTPSVVKVDVKPNGDASSSRTVVRSGVGPIETKFGNFWLYSFNVDDVWEAYEVVYRGEVDKELWPVFSGDHVLLRIDSGCSTGQKFGDLTCECQEQLELAMKMISQNGSGMVIHIPAQDARGHGEAFKLTTLLLQSEYNMDTVESSRALLDILGEDPDSVDVRTYEGVVAILKSFKIQPNVTIKLITNNPHKREGLRGHGFEIECVSACVGSTELTEKHLRAKEDKLGHIGLIHD